MQLIEEIQNDRNGGFSNLKLSAELCDQANARDVFLVETMSRGVGRSNPLPDDEFE
jgi:hypothetical protein